MRERGPLLAPLGGTVNRRADLGRNPDIEKIAAVRAAWIHAVEASDINALIALATDDIVVVEQRKGRHRSQDPFKDRRGVFASARRCVEGRPGHRLAGLTGFLSVPVDAHITAVHQARIGSPNRAHTRAKRDGAWPRQFRANHLAAHEFFTRGVMG